MARFHENEGNRSVDAEAAPAVERPELSSIDATA
jgi:hypothetical protein